MCSSSEKNFWEILPTTYKSGENMRASSQRRDTNVEDVKNISLNPEIFFCLFFKRDVFNSILFKIHLQIFLPGSFFVPEHLYDF